MTPATRLRRHLIRPPLLAVLALGLLMGIAVGPVRGAERRSVVAPAAATVHTPPVTIQMATAKAKKKVSYRNCAVVRAAGKAPIRRGQPGYGRHLDRDGDGIGCETSSRTKRATKPAPVVSRTSVSYRNCAAVRAAGKAPIRRGQPGYAPHLDRDRDGIGCE